jgi:hypothetical protein
MPGKLVEAARALVGSNGRRRIGHGAAALALCAAVAAASPSAAWAAKPARATTSRAAREEAQRAIPFDQLDDETRRTVLGVVTDASIFRRLPTQVVRCDPALYQFMVDHPDAVVDLWRVLGISAMSLERIGPDSFRVDDGQGTTGDMHFVYRLPEARLVFAEGTYEGPLFKKPVHGQCVMLLRTGYQRQPDGHVHVTSRLDTFIRLEHTGAELIAKTFQPLVGKVIDYNFLESMGFLGSLSRTAEVNPQATLALTERMKHISAEERDRLSTLLADIGQRAEVERTAAAAAGRPDPQTARRREKLLVPH